MLNPVAMSIIVTTFTDRRERARAVDIWGSVLGLSLVAGPVLGGLLVCGIGWRAIFWINVPIGIAAIAATGRFVPESRAPHARRLDPAGEALVVLLLAPVTYAIIEGPRRGWDSPLILGLFVLGALAGAALVVAETRRRDPPIDVRFIRSAPFSGASAIAVAAFATLGGFLFLNTLYLQDVRGFSALRAGLLTRLTPDTPVGYLMVAYVIFGAGAGFTTASHAAWAVLGGCGVAVLLLALLSTGQWGRGTARRNGERLAHRSEEVPDDRGVPAAH
jgi:predicted MFS family arabinose efflux permease